MNELLELIKAFNADKNVRITIDYLKPYDAYGIEMREYDHVYCTAYRIKKLIYANDLLSAKLPTYEVFVKVLNDMYDQLKGESSCQKS